MQIGNKFTKRFLRIHQKTKGERNHKLTTLEAKVRYIQFYTITKTIFKY